MSEPKPFASLSPGLLARKGQARPAMRPQAYQALDDLGWNDMGPEFLPGPAVPPVVRQQAEITEEFRHRDPPHAPVAPPEPIAALAPGSRAQSVGKAAFTLRLSGDRHLKLRIACALRNRSAQKIVTEALDAYLKTLPDLDATAERFAATGTIERKTKRGMEE